MRFCLVPLLMLFALPANADAFVSQGNAFSSFKPKPGEPQGCVSGSIGRRKIGKIDKDRIGLAIVVQEETLVGTGKRQSYVEYLYDPPGSKKNDYDDAGAFGKIFTLCLPPGRYHLTTVQILFPTGSTANQQPYDIAITVEDGKDIYIGSLSLLGFIPGAFYALKPPSVPDCNASGTPHWVELSDQSVRDLPLIMAGKSPPRTLPVVALPDPGPDHPVITRCRTGA